MALSQTLYIAAPAARIWALIDEPANLPLWMPEVIETIYPDGPKTADARGTRFVQRVKDASGIKTYQGHVVAYEPGRHLALAMTETMVTISVGYRLTPQDAGTRLDFTGDLKMNNPLFSMMALAAWPMTRAILNRQIADLKRVAETLPLPVAMARADEKPAPTKRAAPKAKKPARKTAAGKSS
jgi:uncharacterized protein YndB with AHSA1/START domain